MSRRPKLPTLPAPPADASPQQRSFFQAIKQQLDALVGQLGERDRAVTFRDLEDGGLARLHADGYTILPGQEGPEGPPGPQGDPGENGTGLPTVAAGVIPPAVTGLKATAAYSSIILTWNDPDWPAGASTFNVAYFEIFRATSATPNPPVPDASYSFGQTRSLVFSDLVGTSKTYYYWVRIVGKNNEIGPIAGPVSATTSPNVPQLLDVLTGQLSESQLVSALNERIDLIDDSGTLTTSVTARIASEATARSNADSALAGQINTVNARLNTGGDTYNAIVQAQTTASAKNASFVQSTTPTATKLNDLWIHTGDQNKVYRWNGSAWVVADDQRIGATASQVTTLQSSLTTLDGEVSDVQTDVASLQISASTSASKITGLEAQYTVKTDVNGRVAGFGLASYGPTDTSPASGYSEFAVVADKFSIAPVATSPAADSHPFFHLTAPTVIDGVTVPAGTYMKQAYIHNAAINTAQIKDAAVDTAKIADAAIVEAKIGDLQVTTAKIDDAAITTAKIGAAQITTALIEDAAITDAKIANTIQSTNYAAGAAGWRINKAGGAEFNDLNARGGVVVGKPGTADQFVTIASEGKTGWYNSQTGFILAHNKNYANSGLTYTFMEFRGGSKALLRWRGGTHPDAASGVLEVSGVLTADAVDAVNTVNIAGQAVTFPNHSRATWTRYDGNYTVANYGTPGGTDGW